MDKLVFSIVTKKTGNHERLKLYCIANSIDTEEKQRAILLSACGPAIYRMIKNIMALVSFETGLMK